jgi:glutamate racemase
VGSAHLASIAEAYLLGQPLDETALAQDFAACFHDDAHGKTSAVVLGCTHYPFLLQKLEALAPWPVTYIDPAPAIARQAARLWSSPPANGEHAAYVTRAQDIASYRPVFQRFGFPSVHTL